MLRGSSVRVTLGIVIPLFALEAFSPGFLPSFFGAIDGSTSENEHKRFISPHTQKLAKMKTKQTVWAEIQPKKTWMDAKKSSKVC